MIAKLSMIVHLINDSEASMIEKFFDSTKKTPDLVPRITRPGVLFGIVVFIR